MTGIKNKTSIGKLSNGFKIGYGSISVDPKRFAALPKTWSVNKFLKTTAIEGVFEYVVGAEGGSGGDAPCCGQYAIQDSTYTLPDDPLQGACVNIMGVGNNWVVIASGGKKIRMTGDESIQNGTLKSTTGYDCAFLTYVGNDRWVVTHGIGALIIDSEEV